MAGALTKFAKHTDLAEAMDPKQMAAALGGASDEASTGNGTGASFLNFSGKMGKYSLGKSKDDMDPDDLYIIEPMAVFAGWQCWKASKPVSKHRWSVYADPSLRVAEGDLEDHGPYRDNAGEGWKNMLGFGAINALDPALQVEFSTDSVSGRNAVSDLLGEIKDRLLAEEPYIPILGFDKEPFEAQGFKQFKPKFVVEYWADREQLQIMHADIGYTLDALLAGKAPTKAHKTKFAKAAVEG